ncbi:GNAT family N-acetyltransferase [Demequina rhizosphaerae]|uniref:GNAT family N-acetyltransferase n=1 Tax=Demequina rhizosphaerae TaxID=1638985 RepID=UPI0007810A83|nr:GNAT family N-acetyltransferase [Demequina rhizosphaerae]
MITVRRVTPDHPDAHALWAEQQEDLARRYDSPDLVLETSFATLVASLVGYADDGEPVASIVLRWSPYPTGAGSLELKRLFVRPGHRGHGHSKVMMGAAEAIARRAGATRIVLESGTGQPEALALYDRLGYRRIASYGEYKDEPDSVCYALDLPTRVLVLTGALGAGKTTVAAAAHELLAARGARTAHLDADALTQAYPAGPADPVNRGLLWDALGAVAPLYRARGYGDVLLPLVMDDAEDPARVARAFRTSAGPAEVTVVRLAAPAEERIRRLEGREFSERWLAWARTRTVEMDGELESLAVEDAVVDGAGRTPDAVAADALDAAGW